MQKFINENEIKSALEKGIITSLEAREMLVVYLHKEKFVHKSITLHQVA